MKTLPVESTGIRRLKANQAFAKESDTRVDRVAEIKNKIENDDYNPPASEVAEALIVHVL